ncbi:hypothetical protein STEPF1_02978 [Streptomyces sp. F-1]|nr:hypothetical protein STEPF1_02978 [Streptomyces sp. F-1]
MHERADNGPYGAQEGTGSPIRVWREAVPVVMAAQRSPSDGTAASPRARDALESPDVSVALGGGVTDRSRAWEFVRWFADQWTGALCGPKTVAPWRS